MCDVFSQGECRRTANVEIEGKTRRNTQRMPIDDLETCPVIACCLLDPPPIGLSTGDPDNLIERISSINTAYVRRVRFPRYPRTKGDGQPALTLDEDGECIGYSCTELETTCISHSVTRMVYRIRR